MRRLTAALAATLLSGFIVLASPSPARACSCVEASDDEYFASADAVFTGTLDRTEDGMFNKADTVVLEFEVDQVYKGDIAERQGIKTWGWSATCGWLPTESGEYLVYAFLEDGELWVGLCGGSRELDGDAPQFGTAADAPSAGSDSLAGPGLWPYAAGTAALAAALVALFLLRRRALRRV